ncbi:MAG TPA: phage holin family protein [Candidatus Saccharimonadales bacterium]|nr:phage holin family protein [Candidatus Saccharimonadales bacterium]
MIAILANWILSAIAIVITANLVPGFKVDTFTTALIVALVLGLLNAIIKPILLLLTLPINLLTLGLFTFVINAGLILLAARLVKGFVVVGFVPALIAAVILWIISMVIHFVLFPVKAV